MGKFKSFGNMMFVCFLYYAILMRYYCLEYHHNILSIQTIYDQKQVNKKLFYDKSMIIYQRL